MVTVTDKQGYGGDIQVTVGVTKDGTVSGVSILSISETAGLGIQPPTASWGSMLSNAQRYIQQAPYLAIFPGILILITVISFNYLGEVLRKVFEPK